MENSTQEYGGFWIRFVAYIIDAIILGAVISVLVVPLLTMVGFSAFDSMQNGSMNQDDMGSIIAMISQAGAYTQIVNIGVGWLYFALLHSSSKQATVGKMALGLKVINSDGTRLNFGQASLRYVGKIISGIILLIGFIMAGFTKNKQALHDIIASTYVVKG